MNHVIFLEKLERNSESLKDKFSPSFALLSLAGDFQKANAILIKSNLTYPVYKEGVRTRKEFVESLVEALRRINDRVKIYIGDGQGGYISFSMTEAMRNMGFSGIEKRYPNVKVVNLSKVQSLDTTQGSGQVNHRVASG